MIQDLKFTKKGQDLVGLSFTTTRCAVVQVSGPAGYSDSNGWPQHEPENCNTEHSLDVGGLQGNTVYDFVIKAIDADQRSIQNGISLETNSIEDGSINIIKTWTVPLSDTAVEVFFETDVCGSPTFVVDGTKIISVPGCQTDHSYIVSPVEPGVDYKVDVVARSEAGESEPETIEFSGAG